MFGAISVITPLISVRRDGQPETHDDLSQNPAVGPHNSKEEVLSKKINKWTRYGGPMLPKSKSK